MNPPLELAAVYRRVSTDRQDESLILQEKRVTDYAVYRKLEIRDGLTFSDPDTSGVIPMMDRDGGRALINRLRLGDVKHLVVAKLDRIGRNTRDALGVLEFLKQNNITLHITDFGGETVSTQGHMGKLILTVLFAMAEWEAGEIKDRTLKIMRGKFDRMELTGNVPYGFDAQYTFADRSAAALSASNLVEIEALHGKCARKQLVPNLAEQTVIRQLHAWRHTPDAGRADELTSYTKVAAMANKERDRLCGLSDPDGARIWRPKQGGDWTCGQVSSVLNSRHTARLLASPPAPTPVMTEQ